MYQTYIVALSAKEEAAKEKEEKVPRFRCLQGRWTGDYKECKKRSDGSRRYCVKYRQLTGSEDYTQGEGELSYDCFSLGDITDDYGFTKTIEETLTCEETKHQGGEKYEFCACSTDLCNASSTASKVSKRNIEMI